MPTKYRFRRIITVSSFTFTGFMLAYHFLIQVPYHNASSLRHDQPLYSSHEIERIRPPPANTSWPERAEQVKLAFLHAYHAYEQAAYPSDELYPLSKEGSNSFNGWGVSVIDSLDTMILMDLRPEYSRALKHVKELEFNATEPIPFFETTIRYLGGLLSAYTLTLERTFLDRAEELGDLLLPAFDTRSGIPSFFANEKRLARSHSPSTKRHAVISEMATFSLEFHTLAVLTGRKDFQTVVDRISDHLSATQDKKSGLWPTQWSVERGVPINSELAVGGNADSAYEYLLKHWLNDPTQIRVKNMYKKASSGILRNLLYLSPQRHLLYVTDLPIGTTPSSKLEHLSCFLPGLLALGTHSLPDLSAQERQYQMWAAEGLATTCWLTYVDHITGLGPDEVVFQRWPTIAKDMDTKALIKGGWEIWGLSKDASSNVSAAPQGRWFEIAKEWEGRRGNAQAGDEGKQSDAPPGVRNGYPMAGENHKKKDYWLRKPAYELRPETIESLYLLWRTTSNPLWRDRAWELCDALDRHTRTPFAYSSIRRVDILPARWIDAMPSWFLAETLKYCFLVATDEDLLPLERFVFNTEAHPLPRFGWPGWNTQFGLKDVDT